MYSFVIGVSSPLSEEYQVESVLWNRAQYFIFRSKSVCVAILILKNTEVSQDQKETLEIVKQKYLRGFFLKKKVLRRDTYKQ